MNTNQMIAKHAVNVKNTPIASIQQVNNGLAILAYRNNRLDYWMNKIGNGDYTTEVRMKASKDVFIKFGVK